MKLKNYICKTCGVQYDASEEVPERCIICEDERQYINWEGQQWTTLEEMKGQYKNEFIYREDGLYSVKTRPVFAIGQQAFLIKTDFGNVLWDCISFIDEETVNQINFEGGLSAIAVSHPHFYSSVLEWSSRFGDIPVYVHLNDIQWVMRKNENINFWEGEEFSINEDLTIIKCGGHFDGSSVLHWKSGDDGRGAILTGDTIQVVPDRRYVSFMYSYPNLIPLPAEKVKNIVNAVEPYSFNRIYGGFEGRTVHTDGKNAVYRSAERYLKAIG